MKYEHVVKGFFVSRPNRFVANVVIDHQPVSAHVKNTGRCKELLVEGATLYLVDYKGDMRSRKYRYSIIGVEKQQEDGSVLMVNMDSLAPNTVVREAIMNGRISLDGFDPEKVNLKMEKTFGDSRLDIFLEQEGRQAFIEVKGVTLENNGKCMFPDAPTIRGVKHMEELIRVREAGMDAYVIFVLQMEGIREFRPNDIMHPAFGDTLRRAAEAGVIPLAFECQVTPDSLHIYRRVKIELYKI